MLILSILKDFVHLQPGAGNQSEFYEVGVKYWRDLDVLIMWENAGRRPC